MLKSIYSFSSLEMNNDYNHYVDDVFMVLSFRDTFSVTWDPSWLTPFLGQLFPVLSLGKNIK